MSLSLIVPEPPPGHMVFTENNHWRFGWGTGIYNYDQQRMHLWVTYGPCNRAPKSFEDEVYLTARKIADATTKRIFVAMSGGLDSEIVARAMLHEKVPFTPVIAQFDNDVNKHDISYAFDFCQQHNLEPEIVKMDVLAMFEDSINCPYVLANCANIMYMIIMRHVHALGGTTILGGGEQRFSKHGDVVFVPVPYERIAITHFQQAEKIEGVLPFYCYTPETMLAIIREAKAYGFGELTEFAHNVKEHMYRKFWPDMAVREKYSGMETVNEARAKAQRALEAKFRGKLTDWKVPVQVLEQWLSDGKY